MKDEDITHIVSFSGGRTSAYLVHLMEQLRKDKGWKVVYVFCDTGAEHDKTYNFIRNIVGHWKIDLTCLRVVVNPEYRKASSYEVVGLDDLKHDLKPWKQIVAKYSLPNVSMPYCTREMKSRPFDKWVADHVNGPFNVWLGIRSDEPNRLKERENFRYLAELSDFEKQDILDWWSEQKFDLGIPEWLGNCCFCVKKSIKKVAVAAIDEPVKARQFATVITSPKVRVKNEKLDPLMYRGGYSFKRIREEFPKKTRSQLLTSMRNGHEMDSGSCSESCEIFPTED